LSATGPIPAPSPAPSARALRRNLAFDVVVAMGYGLTTTVALSLIPTIARQAGLDPIGLAVMAAAPFVGNLLSAFAGRIGPQNVRGFAVLRIVSALLLLAVAFAPGAGLIVVAVGLFQLCLSFTTPFQTRLWGAMYPTSVRARALGVLGTARYAAAGIAAVAVGALADQFGVPLAVTLAGLVGAGFAAAAFGLRSGQPLPTRRYSAKEAVRTLTTHPTLARHVLAQGFFGAGIIASVPLLALVYVDRLHLTLADVGVLAVLSGLATTVSFVGWGSLVDRFGYTLGLRAGAAFGVVSVALVAVAPSWGVVALASVAGGLSAAAMDIGIQGTLAANTKLADRAAAMAGWNSLTGLRGVVAAMAAGALVQAGVVSVPTALLLCLVPAVIGLLLYLGMPVPAIATRVRGAAGRVRRAVAGAETAGA
jgi:MFS family permease